MTQAVNDTKDPFTHLSTYFPLDGKSDERIQRIEQIIKTIPSECQRVIPNEIINFYHLHYQRIDPKVFKAAQKILSRPAIDELLLPENKKNLLQQLLRLQSVFTSVLIDVVKQQYSLAAILNEMAALEKDDTPLSDQLALCLAWADTKQEWEGYLRDIEKRFAISLLKEDGTLNPVSFADHTSLPSIAPLLQKLSLTTEEECILLKRYVSLEGCRLFTYFDFFALDLSLHHSLLLELAEAAVARDVAKGNRFSFEIKDFWLNIPLRPDEKKQLFDCFYRAKQGRDELFAHIEYFGWDLDKDKDEIFILLKEPSDMVDVPDYRRFNLSADQRAEIAAAYSALMAVPHYYDDYNFFVHLPLHDLGQDRLFCLLQTFTRHPSLGKHLHEFSLAKEQKMELIQKCSVNNYAILENFDQLGLDSIQDAPVISNILTYALNVTFKPHLIKKIFSFFNFSIDEKIHILKIYGKQAGFKLLEFLDQLGFDNKEHSKQIFEIYIICFSASFKSKISADQLTTLLQKFNFSKPQIFKLLRLFLKNQYTIELAKDFSQCLLNMGFDTENDLQQVYTLFELAFNSWLQHNTPLLLPHLRQFPFAKAQIWSLLKVYAKLTDSTMPPLFTYIKEWALDKEEDHKDLYELFVILARTHSKEIIKRRDLSFTDQEKLNIYQIFMWGSTILLEREDVEFWLGKDVLQNKERAEELIKACVLSFTVMTDILSKISFTQKDRFDFLILYMTRHTKLTLENISLFRLSEAEYVEALELVRTSRLNDDGLLEGITRLPISLDKKIEILVHISKYNFKKSLVALDKLNLIAEQRETSFTAILSSSTATNALVRFSINELQWLFSIYKKHNLSKELWFLLLPPLLIKGLVFMISQLNEFEFDTYQDCEKLINAIKKSGLLIEHIATVFKTFSLTKEQQVSLLLQQAELIRCEKHIAQEFLTVLMNCQLTLENDRHIIMQILYKWVSKLAQRALPSLRDLTFLSREERMCMARLYVENLDTNALTFLPNFGLTWENDREFMLELIYDCVKGSSSISSNFFPLLCSLPLKLAERQKAALLLVSLKGPQFPLEQLSLMEWDPVQDKKQILFCWEETAKKNAWQVINRIEYFPYGKKEKLALAKRCALSEPEILFSKLPLFSIHPADQEPLFELAVLACIHSALSVATITEGFELSLDSKKSALLPLIQLLIKGKQTKLPDAAEPQMTVDHSTPFNAIQKSLEAKLPDYKEQEWFDLAKQLTEKASEFLQPFESLFKEYMLPTFYKSSIAAKKQIQPPASTHLPAELQSKLTQEFADEVYKILFTAIHTPNRLVKKDVVVLLFLPLLRSLSKNELSHFEHTVEMFNVCVKNAPAETLMIRLYLFGIFFAQKEIKIIAKRIDKLFTSLDKAGKIELTRSLLGFFQTLQANNDFNDDNKWKLFRAVFSNELLLSISQAKRQNMAGCVAILQERILFARVILQCPLFKDYFLQDAPPVDTYVKHKVLGVFPKGLFPQEMESLNRFWINSHEKLAEAFFSYCGSLSALSSEDQKNLFPLWKGYLLATAQGHAAYQIWRNEISAKSAHWQTLSKYPEHLAQWNKTLHVQTTLSSFARETPNYRHIFYQKIVHDSHLNNADYLREYLEKGKVSLPSTDVHTPSLLFQKKAIEFLTHFNSNSTCTPKECKQHLETLKNLLSKFAPESEFMNDLQGLITSLQRDRKNNQMICSATDDPLYLFRMSYEVSGSCQRPDGTPSLNKCLLGYLCNPYIKAVVLEDQTKTLQARAILKLLTLEKSTEQGKEVQPIVFLERPYPPHISNEEVELLWEMAKNVADSLHVPLAAFEDIYAKIRPEQLAADRIELTCAGGIAPYEYADAARGEKKGGYRIQNVFYWK